MKPLTGYIILALGILTGIASNSFAKISDGFTKLTPSILCILLMCITMFSIAKAIGKKLWGRHSRCGSTATNPNRRRR